MAYKFNPFTGKLEEYGPILTGTGTVAAAADGTAALPGISFANDLSVGIYRPGAEQLAFSTNGTGRLFVDASGNVGFGVSSPERPIHLPDGSILLLGTTAATGTQISHSASSNLVINNKEAGAQIFYTSDTERLRITSAGLVGIGTSAPSALLHVSSTGAVESLLSGGGTSGDTVLHLKGNGNAYKFIVPNTAAQYGMGLYDVGNAAYRLFVNSSGNVGIGTTSPGRNLHVVAPSGSGNATFAVERTDATTAALVIGAESNIIKISARETSASSAVGRDIQFESGPLSTVRIDSSGRLLVGTSSARANLFNSSFSAAVQVEGSLNDSASLLITRSSNDSGAPILYLAKTRSSVGLNGPVANNDPTGYITFQGSDGTRFIESASIAGRVDGTPSANVMPGRLVFSTTADGASSPTERMRIRSNGVIATLSPSGSDCLSVGTASAAGTSNYFYAGTHSRTSILGGGTLSYGVFTNGDVVNTNNSYGAISDVKLKENIVDANSQWDDIKALQVRNYNFKEGQTHTQIGLVAQEVELVSPGLVSESPDRDADGNDLGTVTKSVNYSVLYMKAVKALQEAMERIETLEAKVAALESA